MLFESAIGFSNRLQLEATDRNFLIGEAATVAASRSEFQWELTGLQRLPRHRGADCRGPCDRPP
jgi:hypothetical protein